MAASNSGKSPQDDPVLLLIDANAKLVNLLVAIDNEAAAFLADIQYPTDTTNELENKLSGYVQAAHAIGDRFSGSDLPAASLLVGTANEQANGLNMLLEQFKSIPPGTPSVSQPVRSLMESLVKDVTEAGLAHLKTQEEIQEAVMNARFASAQ